MNPMVLRTPSINVDPASWRSQLPGLFRCVNSRRARSAGIFGGYGQPKTFAAIPLQTTVADRDVAAFTHRYFYPNQ